jgi:hypothetical protein
MLKERHVLVVNAKGNRLHILPYYIVWSSIISSYSHFYINIFIHLFLYRMLKGRHVLVVNAKGNRLHILTYVYVYTLFEVLLHRVILIFIYVNMFIYKYTKIECSKKDMCWWWMQKEIVYIFIHIYMYIHCLEFYHIELSSFLYM